METTTVELWVLVDEGGDYVACENADALHERYEEIIGGGSEQSLRRIKVTLTVPLPKPVELVGTVAAEPATGELKTA